MRTFFRAAALAAFAALLGSVGLARADAPAAKPDAAKKADRPQVEVVFCLDTTGSMGGLIEAAKQKIWAISNQIASGTPTPQLKIGLVAYRDRGDEYVTKVWDLTDDLDAIHGHLMGLRANGGGDFPESVNQALHEAITKIKWGTDKKTLRIVFLVGDAPPHMNYPDDVKYQDTCKIAVKNDIIINTVQCGNHSETQKIWQEICRLAEGSYVQIDARGGPVVVVRTPFDDDLAKINAEMARNTLVFGDGAAVKEGKAKQAAAGALAPAAAAERAAFNARTDKAASYDLLDSIKDGKVKLRELKKDQLPEEMQKMTVPEQEAFLKKLEQRREELNKQAVDLDRKRGEFIAKKLAEDQKTRQRDSFDGQVLQLLQRQARRIDVRYETPEARKEDRPK